MAYRRRSPAGLHIADAVQASAALPGAFTPVTLPLAPHKFPKDAGLTSFLLTDGGVYDNMGTEWLLRRRARLRRRRNDRGDRCGPGARGGGGQLVGRALGHAIAASCAVPGVGELMTLLAVKDVLYDQTTALRRRLLDTRYRIARARTRAASRPGPARRHHPDRPLAVRPRRSVRRSSPTTRARAAQAVIARLDATGGRTFWDAEAKANRSVSTNLSKIPADRAAGLLRHAYVLTMANCHVLLGHPLLDIPSVERAQGWVS